MPDKINSHNISLKNVSAGAYHLFLDQLKSRDLSVPVRGPVAITGLSESIILQKTVVA
jgi:hypothetical protein